MRLEIYVEGDSAMIPLKVLTDRLFLLVVEIRRFVFLGPLRPYSLLVPAAEPGPYFRDPRLAVDGPRMRLHDIAVNCDRFSTHWNKRCLDGQLLVSCFVARRFPHLATKLLQRVSNFFGQRFNLLYAARAGEIHDPNECFSFADHNHSVRRDKRLVADASESLLIA
jgi:hypothetical protein